MRLYRASLAPCLFQRCSGSHSPRTLQPHIYPGTRVFQLRFSTFLVASEVPLGGGWRERFSDTILIHQQWGGRDTIAEALLATPLKLGPTFKDACKHFISAGRVGDRRRALAGWTFSDSSTWAYPRASWMSRARSTRPPPQRRSRPRKTRLLTTNTSRGGALPPQIFSMYE